MDIAASAFSDLRLCRRGLVQCAQAARADGLVSGLCPGGGAYLSTYAAQWVTACVHYYELTGERPLLETMFPYAERNIAAFEAQRTPDGVRDSLGWGFVDWGYVRNDGPCDMGVNLHYLASLRDMARWCRLLNKTERAPYYQERADSLADIIGRYFDRELARGSDAWSSIGYHRAVLGLRLGFFQGAREQACIAAIKSHMLHCFPNDASAPRLSDPGVSDSRLITPYFGHFAMSALLERGETDFVLGQYRKCWGWALEDDRTTWLEVFDTRWSHCHQWAGCPTWQLSRFLLGLQPRNDLGARHFVLSLSPGALRQAQGKVPLAEGGAVEVSWSRIGKGIRYRLTTPKPIHVHLQASGDGAGDRVIEVRDVLEVTLPEGKAPAGSRP